MLDIGAGWGGLLCHAAKNYGIIAHGVTLSEEQLAFARAKAKRLGIEDRVTFELNDYSKLTGTYDKIASIGMYEHIGLRNIPAYMRKVRSLLADDGLFLNHAISRRATCSSTACAGARRSGTACGSTWRACRSRCVRWRRRRATALRRRRPARARRAW